MKDIFQETLLNLPLLPTLTKGDMGTQEVGALRKIVVKVLFIFVVLGLASGTQAKFFYNEVTYN